MINLDELASFPLRWTARRLESGSLLPLSLGSPLAAAYATISKRALARPVVLPRGVSVIGVGGCTLGGAGKTIVAIAWARALADAGLSVAFVGHGYRAATRIVQRVTPRHLATDVGDDALLAARCLQDTTVPVWVAPTRERALHEAARHADVLIVDGLLQTRPVPLARSLLIVDALHPFGAQACPPRGDLKAPIAAFSRLVDHVVLVADPATASVASTSRLLAAHGLAPSHTAIVKISSCSNGSGAALSLEEVQSSRVGLALTLARSDRVVASLRARNLPLQCVWRGLDHHSPSPRDAKTLRDLAYRHRLDAWLTTTKCATLFEGKPVGAPLWVINLSTRLDPQPLPVLDSAPCERQDSSAT